MNVRQFLGWKYTNSFSIINQWQEDNLEPLIYNELSAHVWWNENIHWAFPIELSAIANDICGNKSLEIFWFYQESTEHSIRSIIILNKIKITLNTNINEFRAFILIYLLHFFEFLSYAFG